jgi:hypothetical protein
MPPDFQDTQRSSLRAHAFWEVQYTHALFCASNIVTSFNIAISKAFPSLGFRILNAFYAPENTGCSYTILQDVNGQWVATRVLFLTVKATGIIRLESPPTTSCI